MNIGHLITEIVTRKFDHEVKVTESARKALRRAVRSKLHHTPTELVRMFVWASMHEPK